MSNRRSLLTAAFIVAVAALAAACGGGSEADVPFREVAYLPWGQNLNPGATATLTVVRNADEAEALIVYLDRPTPERPLDEAFAARLRAQFSVHTDDVVAFFPVYCTECPGVSGKVVARAVDVQLKGDTAVLRVRWEPRDPGGDDLPWDAVIIGVDRSRLPEAVRWEVRDRSGLLLIAEER